MKINTREKILEWANHENKYPRNAIFFQKEKTAKISTIKVGENMEKYITFSTPIKKKYDDGKTITHKLKF